MIVFFCDSNDSSIENYSQNYFETIRMSTLATLLSDTAKQLAAVYMRIHCCRFIADHVIGLQAKKLLHIDKGQSVLDTGTCAY